MRKCLRCGAEMQEDFTCTGGGGNVLRARGISLKAVYTKAAVCFECGEVSIYIDDKAIEKIKK